MLEGQKTRLRAYTKDDLPLAKSYLNDRRPAGGYNDGVGPGTVLGHGLTGKPALRTLIVTGHKAHPRRLRARVLNRRKRSKNRRVTSVECSRSTHMLGHRGVWMR